MSVEEVKSILEPERPDVPDNWSVAPFLDVVKVVSDKGKRTKQRDYLVEGRIPVIDQGQEFIGGFTNDDGMVFEGELPIVLFGDHTRAVKYVNQRFAVGADGVKLLKPSDCFDSKFFYYLLKSLQIPSRGYSRHFQFLKKFHLPIAPLEQQKRIVAEIEKQFSRLDEAVANLKRVKVNLKRYKAAVLKAAVEGKLTEKWRKQHPDVEPADKLLERILAERRKKWQGRVKYKEPAAPDTSDLPDLPEGWIWVSVDQLVAHLTDGDHQAPPQTDEGIPFLVIGNVRNGEIDFSDTRHVGEAYYDSLDPHRKPQQGDLLYTLVGSYGIPVRVRTDKPFCIQRHMAILRSHEKSPMDYLTLAMGSVDVFNQATAVATGTAQKTVPLAGLRKIAIPLPPSIEQMIIIAEVERCLSNVAEAVGQVDSNLCRADRLRQSILRQAFSGQLVTQNPNDEPASALLERTKVSSNQTNKITKAKKARKVSKVKKGKTKIPLLDVIRRNPRGISPEALLAEANYYIEEIDLFYEQLALIKEFIIEEKPNGSRSYQWPKEPLVLLKPRGA